MDLKEYLICLSTISMLMLCVPSVAAAPMGKLAMGAHNGYTTDARVQLTTKSAL